MRAAYEDGWTRLYTGGALDVLPQLPEKSIHMAVTSPPYFGLRSYLPDDHPAKAQEIGAEKTPEDFVENLVDVFGEVWRVLRDDGTLWVNISDSYSKKQLGMIPAHLAISLQSWGWYLRQEIVWAKPSPMPESVKDRCTRSHEFIYMLTKKPRYYYDQDAIREPHTSTGVVVPWRKRDQSFLQKQQANGSKGRPKGVAGFGEGGRNARDVWHMSTKGFKGSHFAVFPPELPMRCIKAGTSEYGVCAECGAPWRRVVQSKRVWTAKDTGQTNKDAHLTSQAPARNGNSRAGNVAVQTVGWEPTCTPDAPIEPSVVLDPFAGSGTTLYVASQLGRRSVGIDIDERSAELLAERMGAQERLGI